MTEERYIRYPLKNFKGKCPKDWAVLNVPYGEFLYATGRPPLTGHLIYCYDREITKTNAGMKYSISSKKPMTPFIPTCVNLIIISFKKLKLWQEGDKEYIPFPNMDDYTERVIRSLRN